MQKKPINLVSGSQNLLKTQPANMQLQAQFAAANGASRNDQLMHPQGHSANPALNHFHSMQQQSNNAAQKANGRSSSGGPTYSFQHGVLPSKQAIQPVFAGKNRKVKNTSFSQQRIEKLDKFTTSSGTNGAKATGAGVAINSTLSILNNLPNASSAMLKQPTVQQQYDQAQSKLSLTAPMNSANPQNTQQILAGYSTQNYPVQQAQPQQIITYQMQNTVPAFGSILNQKNIRNHQKNAVNQQKVVKGKRLGSSHGTSNNGSQPIQTTNLITNATTQGQSNASVPHTVKLKTQYASGKMQAHNSSTSYLGGNTLTQYATGRPTVKERLPSGSGTRSAGITSEQPKSAGRSKTVYNQDQGVYGLNQGAPTSSQKNGLMNMTQTNQYLAQNDPYSPQVQQTGGAGQVPLIKNTSSKPAKQQRSLSDQLGGTRRQGSAQHGTHPQAPPQHGNIKSVDFQNRFDGFQQTVGAPAASVKLNMNSQQLPSHPQISGGNSHVQPGQAQYQSLTNLAHSSSKSKLKNTMNKYQNIYATQGHGQTYKNLEQVNKQAGQMITQQLKKYAAKEGGSSNPSSSHQKARSQSGQQQPNSATLNFKTKAGEAGQANSGGLHKNYFSQDSMDKTKQMKSQSMHQIQLQPQGAAQGPPRVPSGSGRRPHDSRGKNGTPGKMHRRMSPKSGHLAQQPYSELKAEFKREQLNTAIGATHSHSLTQNAQQYQAMASGGQHRKQSSANLTSTAGPNVTGAGGGGGAYEPRQRRTSAGKSGPQIVANAQDEAGRIQIQANRHSFKNDTAASAAPASGANSTGLATTTQVPPRKPSAGKSHGSGMNQTTNNVFQAPKHDYMTQQVNALTGANKQIPMRQIKLRKPSGHSGSSLLTGASFGPELRSEPKEEKDQRDERPIEYSDSTGQKQSLHRRQRIPSASSGNISIKQQKVTSSGGASSKQATSQPRVPSGNRLKQSSTDMTQSQASHMKHDSTGRYDKQSKDQKQGLGDGIKIAEPADNLGGRTRSSITNIRRSRNEANANLPTRDNSGFDAADNPTSAGQSTSSLYKQEQVRKKFKLDEPSTNEKQKSAEKKDLKVEEERKSTSATATNNTKDPKKKGNKLKEIFGLSSQGMSGRNLYFNQIRNEITVGQQPPAPNATGKQRGLPDYQNAKFSNKRNGLVAGYGANTNQGIVRNYNEDRVAIILNIMKPKSKNYENQQWPKCSFFGIYDGHGGAVCADFLRDYLHQFIIKDENFPANPIQALRNGFREAERLFIEFAESQEKEAGDIDRSGSCAVVILIIDDMCYCANTGDSRAIMSADGGEKLFLLSTDHKPTDEIEMKRIIEHGGRIYQNSQVIQNNNATNEQGKQMVYGPHRVFPGRLSVSRTIGDIEAKVEKYEGNPNVVIADPDVTAFEIKDNHDFIVIGCDGVFDKLSSKDAIHIAWQKVLMEAAEADIEKVELEQTHKNCGFCVDGILRTSALRRTVDNVTCVVVAFDGFQKQLQKFINHSQDGTTVDVIEEIQLEPIPEYLSNTKLQRPAKRSADNSMLLLDENQLSDTDNPALAFKRGTKTASGGNTPQSGVPGANGRESRNQTNILSEIAEEDDISSVSESAHASHSLGARISIGGQRSSKDGGDAVAEGGQKSSIRTETASLNWPDDQDKLSETAFLKGLKVAPAETQSPQLQKSRIEHIVQKRRSQLLPVAEQRPLNHQSDETDGVKRA